METTIYVRMPLAKVRHIIYGIPSAAKRGGSADDILIKAGIAVLSRIENAFLVKSRGGTDEAGERWAPLSPVTIARRLRKRNRTKEHDRPSSALNSSQRSKWWDFYRRALVKYKDKSIAARIAWTQTKRLGGVGHFDKYGASSVPILIDTEQLLNSLRPNSSSEHKIFRVGPGEAELGTDRKGAKAHHTGVLGKLPQRRLWPDPNKWPSAWWQEVLNGARLGLMRLIVEKFK